MASIEKKSSAFVLAFTFLFAFHLLSSAASADTTGSRGARPAKRSKQTNQRLEGSIEVFEIEDRPLLFPSNYKRATLAVEFQQGMPFIRDLQIVDLSNPPEVGVDLGLRDIKEVIWKESDSLLVIKVGFKSQQAYYFDFKSRRFAKESPNWGVLFSKVMTSTVLSPMEFVAQTLADPAHRAFNRSLEKSERLEQGWSVVAKGFEDRPMFYLGMPVVIETGTRESVKVVHWARTPVIVQNRHYIQHFPTEGDGNFDADAVVQNDLRAIVSSGTWGMNVESLQTAMEAQDGHYVVINTFAYNPRYLEIGALLAPKSITPHLKYWPVFRDRARFESLLKSVSFRHAQVEEHHSVPAGVASLADRRAKICETAFH